MTARRIWLGQFSFIFLHLPLGSDRETKALGGVLDFCMIDISNRETEVFGRIMGRRHMVALA